MQKINKNKGFVFFLAFLFCFSQAVFLLPKTGNTQTIGGNVSFFDPPTIVHGTITMKIKTDFPAFSVYVATKKSDGTNAKGYSAVDNNPSDAEFIYSFSWDTGSLEAGDYILSPSAVSAADSTRRLGSSITVKVEKVATATTIPYSQTTTSDSGIITINTQESLVKTSSETQTATTASPTISSSGTITSPTVETNTISQTTTVTQETTIIAPIAETTKEIIAEPILISPETNIVRSTTTSAYTDTAIKETTVSPTTVNNIEISVPITQQIETTNTVKPAEALIKISYPLNNGVLSSWSKFAAKTYGPIIEVLFIKISSSEINVLGKATHLGNGDWVMPFDTTKIINGTYTLAAKAHVADGREIQAGNIIFSVKNSSEEPIGEIAPAPSMEIKNPEYTDTRIEPAPMMPAQEIAPAPMEIKITPEIIKEEAASLISPVCQKNGINNAEECARYLRKIFLPLECQKMNIADPAACQEKLKSLVQRPSECAGLSDADCEKTLSQKTTLSVSQLTFDRNFSEKCREIGASSLAECETLMRERYAVKECWDLGAKIKEECRTLLEKKYGHPAECSALNEKECANLVDNVILKNFTDKEISAENRKEITSFVGKHIKINQAEKEEIKAELKKIIPLAKEEKANFLVLGSEDKGDEFMPAVILVDTDGDGLIDTTEKRLGTDPNSADSDNDGWSDNEEIKSGHNPLGDGLAEEKLSPVEKAIANKEQIEQPKNSGLAASETLAVDKASELKVNEEKSLIKIEGRALPNETVTIFIYSVLPMVLTVTADKNGNWVYELDKSLIDGRHEVYVAVNDQEGKIKAQSAPLSFFVKEARAVDREEFLKAEAAVSENKTIIIWYSLAGLGFILFALGLYFLLSKKKEEEEVKIDR